MFVTWLARVVILYSLVVAVVWVVKKIPLKTKAWHSIASGLLMIMVATLVIVTNDDDEVRSGMLFGVGSLGLIWLVIGIPVIVREVVTVRFPHVLIVSGALIALAFGLMLPLARSSSPVLPSIVVIGLLILAGGTVMLHREGQTRNRLITALEDNDKNVRKTAIEALKKVDNVWAIEPLIATLRDSDRDVRKIAAEALGEWEEDARVVEGLIATLKDSDTDVRRAAAEALDSLGWQPSKNEVGAAYYIAKQQWDKCIEIGTPAVEPLIAALKNSDPDMRYHLVFALGRLGDVRAVEPLIAALKDESEGVCSRAAYELGELGDARAVEPLVAALKNSARHVRSEAVKALEKLRDGRAVEPLITLLKEGNKFEREAAAAVLVTIGTPAVDSLIAALQDIDEDVREEATKALGRIGDARADEPLIAALKDRTRKVRKAALEVLDELGWEPDLDEDWDETGAWYWIAKEEWDEVVKIGTPAVEPLIAALEDDTTRMDAATALGEIGDARAVEPLVTLLKEGNKFEREAAAEALVTISTPAVDSLIAVLQDSDVCFVTDVYLCAVETLGAIGDGRAVEPLIAALKHSEEDVHAEAAKALGEIGDARAVEPLIAALKDKDEVVRKVVAEALVRLGKSEAAQEVLGTQAALQKKDGIADDIKLHAIRRYLNYLANNWWNSQPATRATAICDACSNESIERNDGYLVGSNLWCEECWNGKAVGWIKESGADEMLGHEVLAQAMKMFGSQDISGTGTDEDAIYLQAEPISRKRMDLLWLDPPRLALLDKPILEDKVISVVMGDSTDIREHSIDLDDYQWAKQVEKIVDKALAASESGKYHDSIRYYKQALELAPGCDLFLMNIGAGYGYLGEKEKAIKYLERAAEISPGNTRIRDNLANVRRL